jgi:hypothetical protein
MLEKTEGEIKKLMYLAAEYFVGISGLYIDYLVSSPSVFYSVYFILFTDNALGRVFPGFYSSL